MPAFRKIVLTDRYLKALNPAAPGKRPIIWDAAQPHLGVRVTDKGHLSFVVIRRRPGDKQPVRHVLGSYPAMKLTEAREATPEVLAALARGIHPGEIEADRLRELASKRRDTFGVVAEEFIKRHVQRLRSARATELLIRRELLGQKLKRRNEGGKLVEEWVDEQDARWRKRPITEITRRDVVELLEGIADQGSRYQARKTFAAASKLFNWAIWRDTYGLESSPLTGLKSADLFGTFEARTRVLTDDELRLVWHAAMKTGYPFGTLVQTLLLTGQRLRELSDACWNEIDLQKALLTVPPERMKGKIAHTVPLTSSVMRLLESIPRFRDIKDKTVGTFIFTTTAGKRPVSGFAKMKSRLDREIEKLADGSPIPHWTLHDLRRTVRTRLSGLGALPLVAELIIGHKQGGIQAVYDLHTYDAEKRVALEKWETALATITESSRDGERKIVPMQNVKRR
ncbi:MAG: hypothetical protein RL274_664 [Pseudomonadota bacterium]|jgi:integrase